MRLSATALMALLCLCTIHAHAVEAEALLGTVDIRAALIEAGYWRRGPDVMAPVCEKPVTEWTEEEQAAHRRLEERVRRDWPSDRLEFEDGSEWQGWIRERHPAFIVFEERYGQSGSMKVTVPLSRVRAIHETGRSPPVTYRDVEFHLEFPHLFFCKAPPYTLISDERYQEVRQALDELQRLYREIVQAFVPLIPTTARREDIQVLVFGQRAAFDAYLARYAPDLNVSSGFYNPWRDRLVWFNQRDAEAVARARTWLQREEERHRRTYAGRPGAQFQIDEWKREMERRIEAFAREMTIRTLRHEGAHQLFFSLGVHSKYFVEPDWLYEGMASYAEVRPLGARNPERVGVVKEALDKGENIPLRVLMRSKDVRGLLAFGNECRVELAYSEAWSVVYYLMEPPRRALFMKYLDYLRAPENAADVAESDPFELLCRFLETTPANFEDHWARWARDL